MSTQESHLLCTVFTETQICNQNLSVGAQQRKSNRGQLFCGYPTFVMTKHTALTGQPSTYLPMKLSCRQACRVPEQGVHWASHAGHLLLSYQKEKLRSTLPTAPSAHLTSQG
eukprot:1151079-Pelagomonas_calceolata.AAC.2